MPEVVPLAAHEYTSARTALGRAFFDYELMVYALAEPAPRAAAVEMLYGAILSDCYRYGQVHTTDKVAGAACWLPPGVPVPGLWRQVRAGLVVLPWKFGRRGMQRLLAYDEIARALHHEFAPKPHWYLAALGVSPEFQGQGVGSDLIRPILEQADREQMPCYLDTHRERNVQLYERHGFQIGRRVVPDGHPVPVWGMFRPPRRPTASQ